MSETSDPIVTLRDVHLALTSRAGTVEILRGVDLSVKQGRSLAIVGPSGSGKTSLLMVMAGLERPTSGLVRIAGQDIGQLNEDGLARLRGSEIGIVFQSFHLVPTMTALENIALPLELKGQLDAFDVASKLLQQVGLSDRCGHFPAELSGGEQQRIALARALSTEPKLILADEPTGNLDVGTGEQIIDLMFKMQRAMNTTLILITHDERLAQRCEDKAFMRDGRLIFERTSTVPKAHEAEVR